MARKRKSAARRLTIRSKKQQRFVWGVLVKNGTVSSRKAKARSKKGKAYKRLPSRVKRGKKK